MPAPNELFGAMAAVTPQKWQCKLAREYPAGSLVEAATSRSRRHVVCKSRTVQRDNEVQTI